MNKISHTEVHTSDTAAAGWKKDVLPLLLALVPLCLLWQGKVTVYGLEMDEGMVLLYPQLILDGALPHLDFETFYTPGNLWFLSGVYALLGNSIEAARFFGLLYHLGLIFGVYVIARPAGGTIACLAAFTAGVVLSPLGLTPFAWLLGVLLVFWALILALQIDTTKTASTFQKLLPYLCGFLAGLGVLVRQDVGLAMLLVLACVFLWGGFKNAVKALCGVVAATLPLGAHLLAVGWQPMWENLIVYPIFLTRGGRDFPLSHAGSGEQALVYASFLAVLPALIQGWLIWRRNSAPSRERTVELRVTLVWPVLFFALVHQMMQRVEHIHVAFVAFLPVAMLWPCLFQALKMQEKGWIRIAIAIPSLLALGLICREGDLSMRYLNAFKRAFGEENTGWPVTTGDRKFYLRSTGQQAAAQGVVDFLNAASSPGEKLVVGPGDFSRAQANDTFYYYLLYETLKPGTYFLEFNPGSANREGTRLAEDVASSHWVILNGIYRHWREPNTSHVPGDLTANKRFAEQYKMVYRAGYYEVYRNFGTGN